MTTRPPQKNRLSLDNEIAIRSSIGAWWGSWLTSVILIVAVRNLFINTRTLTLTSENLENTKRNAENTTEMIEQLKKINSQLERMT